MKGILLKIVLLTVLTASSVPAQPINYLKNLYNKTPFQITGVQDFITDLDSALFASIVGQNFRDVTAAILQRGYSADDFASFEAAVTQAAIDNATVVVSSPKTVTASLVIPANVSLWFARDGRLILSSGITLTINGQIVGNPLHQIFVDADPASENPAKVVFGMGSVSEVYSEWWGAVADSSTLCAVPINRAIASMPSGSTIKFLPSNKGYLVESRITLPSHVDNRQIMFDGGMANFYYTGTDILFFIAGDTTTTGQPQNGPRAPNGPRHVIQNFRAKRVHNVSSGAYGEAVRLQDCVQQTVKDFHIEGFEYGIRLYIDDKAQRWVEGSYIANGRIRRCRKGINFFAKSKGTKTNSTSFRNNTIYNVTITGQGPAALSLTDTTYGIKIDREANVYDGQWTKLDIFSANRGVCIYVNGRLHGLTGQVAIENVGNNDTSAVYWYFDQYARTLWGDIKWGIVGRKLGKYFVFKPNVEGNPTYRADEGTTDLKLRDSALRGRFANSYNGYTLYNVTRGNWQTVASYNPTLKEIKLSLPITGQTQGDFYYLANGNQPTSSYEGTLTADSGTNPTILTDYQLSATEHDYYNGWTLTALNPLTGATIGTATVLDYVGGDTKTLILASPITGLDEGTVYHLNNGITYDALQGLKSQLPVSTPHGPDAGKDKHRGESWLIKPNEFSRIMSVVRADEDSLSDQRYVMDVQSDGRVTIRGRRGTPMEFVDIADERGKGGDLLPVKLIDVGNTRVVSDSSKLDIRNLTYLKLNSVSTPIDSFTAFKGGMVGQRITMIVLDDNVLVSNLVGGTGSGRLFLVDNRTSRWAAGTRSEFVMETEAEGLFARELWRHTPMKTTTWDPANLAAGATDSLSVTYIGAMPGDVVDVGLSSIGTANANFDLKGHVVSENTIRVFVTNRSAGAYNIPSGTLRYKIIK